MKTALLLGFLSLIAINLPTEAHAQEAKSKKDVALEAFQASPEILQAVKAECSLRLGDITVTRLSEGDSTGRGYPYLVIQECENYRSALNIAAIVKVGGKAENGKFILMAKDIKLIDLSDLSK